VPGGLTPEQKARLEIDALLEAAGWKVQDKEELNLSAGRGIAAREFHVKGGFADYLLYGDKKVLGCLPSSPESPAAGRLVIPERPLPDTTPFAGIPRHLRGFRRLVFSWRGYL
jgi:hypothetical protein